MKSVVASNRHACVISVLWRLECWGWNGYGQNDGLDQEDELTLVQMVGAGGAHTC